MLVKVVDGSPVPYSIRKLRADNPQVSMRDDPSDETLAEFDVYRVADADQPPTDDDMRPVRGEITLVDGVWTQQWTIEPKPVFVPSVISDRQFFHALAKQGKLSEDEALAAVSTGTIPATMLAIVDAIEDDAARFDAKMFLSGAVEFRRNHPLVAVFANAMGMTDAEVDALFVFAGTL